MKYMTGDSYLTFTGLQISQGQFAKFDLVNEAIINENLFCVRMRAMMQCILL